MSMRFGERNPEYVSYRECWEDLANAVILQAVKDYRKALRLLKSRPDNRELKREKRNCEMFFNSLWFRVLSRADPDLIMDGIRKEEAV